jgi:8-oxo-dGTP pyrophosphatase MutT (NUDIX family)
MGRLSFGGKMKKKRIRPLAICVFRHQDRILVSQGYDSVKDEYFYRPLGGGIEFGESSVETLCRELMEEINAEVDRDSLKYLGTAENIFHFNGKKFHEIILIYDGALKDKKLYDLKEIKGQEDHGEVVHAIWKPIADFGTGKSILYPTGLIEMLITPATHTP